MNLRVSMYFVEAPRKLFDIIMVCTLGQLSGAHQAKSVRFKKRKKTPKWWLKMFHLIFYDHVQF